MRLIVTKSILWLLAGLGLTVIVLRLLHGPGSVTVLSDIIPWGLWKGGGVVALVAIGGAGFTLAMFVHIFQWKRYAPLVRGAVLLALLCYSSVALGLTIDIGVWWRIVFPIVFWQFDSVLFEVAWCIILYLTVLFFEFSHAPLERLGWARMLKAVERATVVLVIAGISLSTLHQSSLGTLFLATPYRLHPLWHTDLLPAYFFITSIGVGCLTISVATLLVHALYEAKPPMHALSGVGGISAILLAVYLVLRFAQIAVTGKQGLLFEPTWDVANFWIEILLSAAIPVILLAQKRFRSSPRALLWIGLATTVGIALNRVNVAGLATLSLTSADYVPALSEWAVTAGILSAAALFFLFAVERLKIFAAIDAQAAEARPGRPAFDHTDWPALFFGVQRHGRLRLYSFMFVSGLALCFGCLPDDAVYGVSPEETPTTNPRVVRLQAKPNPALAGRELGVPSESALHRPGWRELDALMIDGQRNGRYVMFDHDGHAQRLKRRGHDCAACHHMTTPYEKASGCYHCHSDMYLPVDIFDHPFHVARLDGNRGCVKCHVDPDLPKKRQNTTACRQCHPAMRAAASLVRTGRTQESSLAAGYMDAMHGLCIDCHEQKDREAGRSKHGLAECASCHRDLPGLDSQSWERLR